MTSMSTAANNKDALKDRRVLVTGADGFIGSHLCEQLVRRGALVRALSYYNSFNNWGWLEHSEALRKFEVVCGDIRDAAYCRKITEEAELIFHLAALIAIPYSYDSPGNYVDTNIRGTLNILEGARENKAARIVQMSSSEVYGTARYVPIDEKHPLQPQSPYSATKIGADSLALSFFHSFSLPVVVARPFNTYGPRQSARAIIPTVIAQIAAGESALKLGDLTPTRDLTYVEDTCAGLLALAECDKAIGEVVNIGSNFEVSMFDLVMKIRALMGSDIEVRTDPERLRPKGSEVCRLWCDNTKMRRLTGFTAHYSLDYGLKKTISWFMGNGVMEKYKASIYNK